MIHADPPEVTKANEGRSVKFIQTHCWSTELNKFVKVEIKKKKNDK